MAKDCPSCDRRLTSGGYHADAMDGRDGKCPVCGCKVEAPNGTPRTCYGCYLDAMIPADYQYREGYTYDAAFGTTRATRHPATGVPILDERRQTIEEAAKRCSERPRQR